MEYRTSEAQIENIAKSIVGKLKAVIENDSLNNRDALLWDLSDYTNKWMGVDMDPSGTVGSAFTRLQGMGVMKELPHARNWNSKRPRQNVEVDGKKVKVSYVTSLGGSEQEVTILLDAGKT